MSLNRRSVFAAMAALPAAATAHEKPLGIVANRAPRPDEIIAGALHVNGRVIDPGRIYTQAEWGKAAPAVMARYDERRSVMAVVDGWRVSPIKRVRHAG